VSSVIYNSSSRDSVIDLLAPWRILRNLFRHKNLIFQFTRREVEKRYRGTFLGLFWAFFTPLLMLCVYTLVFGFIFGGSFGHPGESKTQFALGLFCGLLIWELIGAAASVSPGLVVSNLNYVTKVIFPLEILPFCMVAAAFVHVCIGFIPLILFILITQGGLHPTAFGAIPLLIPILLYCLALSWMLSALGVFLRDIVSLVPPCLTVLMFLSAIFFPITAIPHACQWIVKLNPAAILISQARNAVVFGYSIDPLCLGIQILISAALAIGAYAFFMRCKPAFADVL
jgi:lipopolysaccharide transport system permease protein